MNHIRGYENWLTTEKKASENTRSSYVRDVRQYSVWLEHNGLEVIRVTTEEIQRYAKYLEQEGKSEATVVRSIASLKSFYTYLLSAGVEQSRQGIYAYEGGTKAAADFDQQGSRSFSGAAGLF